MSRRPFSVLGEHSINAFGRIQLALDQPDRTVSLACFDIALEVIELHQVVLAFLAEYLLHPPLVHFVRIRLHYDANHCLSGPLTNVHDVVDVDDFLLPVPRLLEQEHANVHNDLSDAALLLSQMVEQFTVECLPGEMPEDVAAQAGLDHDHSTVR